MEEKEQKKTVQFNDFIALYKGFFRDEHVEQFLEHWEFTERVIPDQIVNRQSEEGITKREKADNAIGFNTFAHNDKVKHLNSDFEDFQRYLNGDILELYNAEYPGFGRPASIQGKMQKTLPGEGYHVWHCEYSPTEPTRVLAWALFLNDVEEGGELEFLHQNTRIKPKKGDFVVWPAQFTHMHRGNPPLSGEKYIVTGWYQYVELNHLYDETF